MNESQAAWDQGGVERLGPCRDPSQQPSGRQGDSEIARSVFCRQKANQYVVLPVCGECMCSETIKPCF